MREAYFGAEADRLILVTYETLTADLKRTLGEIYDFLGLSPFTHHFDDVVYDADEFDRRLGTPGLHRVGRCVDAVARQTILPPSLSASFAGDAFWREPSILRGVRVV